MLCPSVLYFSERVEFLSVVGFLLLSAAVAVLIKGMGFKGAELFVTLAVVIFFGIAIDAVAILKDGIFASLIVEGVESYAADAMKLVGVGYLGGIGSDICRELGEGGIAKCIGIATGIEMLMLALPYAEDIMELALGILGG